MLPAIISGVALALKVALPVILPPLMQKLEASLPNKGDGPQRRTKILAALNALATSLINDGAISDAEAEDLLAHAGAVIETFVPAMNAAREAEPSPVRIEQQAKKVVIYLEGK